MLRYLFVVPIVIHGFAHLSGFLAAFTDAEVGYAKKPWVLTDQVFLNRWPGRAFGLVWLLSMIGLVSSGAGILLGQTWWPELLVGSSILSLAAILPWMTSVPPGAIAGAVFDVLILIVLLSPLKARLMAVLI